MCLICSMLTVSILTISSVFPTLSCFFFFFRCRSDAQLFLMAMCDPHVVVKFTYHVRGPTFSLHSVAFSTLAFETVVNVQFPLASLDRPQTWHVQIFLCFGTSGKCFIFPQDDTL